MASIEEVIATTSTTIAQTADPCANDIVVATASLTSAAGTPVAISAPITCLTIATNSTTITTTIASKNDISSSTAATEDSEAATAITAISTKTLAAAAVATKVEKSPNDMLGEVFDKKSVSELEGGSLEDPSNALSDGMDKNCQLCGLRLVSPRVLSCLHVFCEACLVNLVNDEASSVTAAAAAALSATGGHTGFSSKSSNSSVVSDLALTPITVGNKKNAVICPTCKQVTTLGPKGIQSLSYDYIVTNIFDLSTIESEKLSCTSCTSKEKAISRCTDCANFLCGGCDNAHMYMRCFENHEVVKLEELQKSSADKPVTIHKPMFCDVHAGENLKYYCFNCQIPVCNDCLIADHKGSEHHYDVIANAEKMVRGDVENLMKEAKSKVQYCDDAAGNLSSSLTELQSQHDCARDQILDTYTKYKKILEDCRDKSLSELNKLHAERELKIMDLLQNIENTMGKIETTCKFTTRVLSQANAAEFLSLKKLISTQLMHLINNTPKCDINYSLTFDTKNEKFKQMAYETFGKFRTESSSPSPKESTPPPTLPGMPPNIMSQRNNMNNSGNSQSHLAGSVTASSPISMPNSMQSSFDGDLSVLGNGYHQMINALAPESPSAHHAGGVNGLHHQSSLSQQQQHLNAQSPFNGLGSGAGSTALAQGGNLNSLIAGMNINGCNISNGSTGGSANGLHNGITNALASSINGLSNGHANPLGGLVGNMNGSNVGNNSATNAGGAPPHAYNSMLEYNLTRLASLNENTNDALVDPLVGAAGGGVSAGNVGGAHQNSIVPANTNQTITLADILSGDQRAFNNLQALAKLGMSNNDFCLPTPTSPSLPMTPIVGQVDDLSLSNFHAGAPPSAPSIITGRNKATPMQIRCKFGSLGTSKGQFNSPHGFCLGVDEEIIVADTNNHRIEVFDKSGVLKFQFGVPGKEEGQLWYPRKVAVMHTNGKFVVCDRGNERSRMQIFSKSGHFMRKIAIRYIDIVAGLAVTNKGHIVAVDSVSPTVFVISEDGELVRWFDCSDYMREPSDIAIRDNDFYVCDFKGHCVAVFQEDGTFQYRIGNEKITCFPNGIDISNAGDILIGDSHGNRFHVACYSREGVLQSEFECPHVKVSRCCGLKITSEGYVVTLAKNNHHVLVLNTLYVN